MAAPDMASDEAPPVVAMWRRVVAAVLKTLLALAILAFAAWGAGLVLTTAPDADRRPLGRDARLVDVAPARVATSPPVVVAWGVVEPARLAMIRPQISGRVLSVHPEMTEGGRIPAGEEMVRLDDTDYVLALERARAELAKVEAEVAMERGNQAVARREYQLLGRQLRPEEEALVLRQPQLARLEADRAAAGAAVRAAEIEVSRASIPAPFDAIVLSETVDTGTALSAGSEIATLVGADRFFVNLALSPAALGWIELPAQGERGSEVRLHDDAAWGAGQIRTGYVVRLSARLTEIGRMTEVVVALDDPLAERTPGAPPVLLGAYLRAEIDGRPIEGAVAIDRAALRDGDTVWVMTSAKKLEVREVEVAWRGADEVLLTGGVGAGEMVVTSQLPVIAEGMALRTRDDPRPASLPEDMPAEAGH